MKHILDDGNVFDETDELENADIDEVEVDNEIVVDDGETPEVEIEELGVNDVMQLIVDDEVEVDLIEEESELDEKLSFATKQTEAVELLLQLVEQ